MTIAPRLLVPALLLSGFATQAAQVRVCIEDRADIGGPARAGLLRELRALLPNHEYELTEGLCNVLDGADVLLSIVDERRGIPPDALGLAYRAGGAILPRLEVFVRPVLRLTRAGDWETLGMALARVAAHELIHYREQTDTHRTQGLMQARLTRAELVSEELRPRLMAFLQHD